MEFRNTVRVLAAMSATTAQTVKVAWLQTISGRIRSQKKIRYSIPLWRDSLQKIDVERLDNGNALISLLPFIGGHRDAGDPEVTQIIFLFSGLMSMVPAICLVPSVVVVAIRAMHAEALIFSVARVYASHVVVRM